MADNSTSDTDNVDPNNDGEQLSVEANRYTPTGGDVPTVVYNQNVTVYHNTISGDGAESLGRESVGILVQPGYNIIVADNDISNVTSAIQTYNNGNFGNASNPIYIKTYMPFAMFVGNIIHNVNTGINLDISTVHTQQNEPWFIGCSFNGNIINGGRPGSTGILFNSYAGESNDPPQVLMNVFNGDIVTGVATGVRFDFPPGQSPNQVENIIFAEDFFFSDGSAASSLEEYASINPPNPAIFIDTPWQGFWMLPTT